MFFNIIIFFLGVCFGFLLQKSNFCVVGAITKSWNGQFYFFKMYFIALFMSLFIMQGFLLLFSTKFSFVFTTGVVEYKNAIFAPLFSILGGAIFGLGAVFAAGCPSRQIIFLTRGKLEALFVLLIMGYIGFLFQEKSLFLLEKLEIEFFFSDNTRVLFQPDTLAFMIRILLMIICFIFLCYFFSSSVFWLGSAMGIIVTAGWIITIIGNNYSQEIMVQSFNFIAPFSKIFSPKKEGIFDFYVWSILGVFFGCILYLWKNNSFQKPKIVSCSLVLRLFGGALMGAGLGCTIGQGIAGIALLSQSSLLAFSACCLTISFFSLVKKKVAASNDK